MRAKATACANTTDCRLKSDCLCRAAAYIKLGDQDNAALALDDATSVLGQQRSSAKAFFRRGQARLILQVRAGEPARSRLDTLVIQSQSACRCVAAPRPSADQAGLVFCCRCEELMLQDSLLQAADQQEASVGVLLSMSYRPLGMQKVPEAVEDRKATTKLAPQDKGIRCLAGQDSHSMINILQGLTHST